MPPLLLILPLLYPTSTADILLLVRPLKSSRSSWRRIGLTTPPAACLRTRPAHCCCCGQAQSTYKYSLIRRTKKTKPFDVFQFCLAQPCVPTHVAASTVVARPTLNRTEKLSFVCVRAQSPPGLALVPCALSTVDKRDRIQC